MTRDSLVITHPNKAVCWLLGNLPGSYISLGLGEKILKYGRVGVFRLESGYLDWVLSGLFLMTIGLIWIKYALMLQILIVGDEGWLNLSLNFLPKHLCGHSLTY